MSNSVVVEGGCAPVASWDCCYLAEPAYLVESMKMAKEREARRGHGREKLEVMGEKDYVLEATGGREGERLCEWMAPSCLKKHKSV
jgi:hypothetical protein